MTALIDQQRAASAQRGYLLFFLFFFLLMTANDFTPARTRRNQRASSRTLGESASTGDDARAPTRKEEVRDKVIIDLSESNARLESENRRLRASAVGLREALKKRGGEVEAKEIDEAYNLTSLTVSDARTPQLRGRDIEGKLVEEEADGVRKTVAASRRLLRERFGSTPA